MMKVFHWSTVAVLSLPLSVVLLAQAPVLDIKMGLWELTTTANVGGRMPTVDTSKMTPEQKARAEAAMKSMSGPHTRVAKTCMTREKFNRSNFLTNQEPGTCKQTVSTNTRTALDANVVCTGERAMSGQFHMDAPSPTSFKGTMKSSSTQEGKTMTVDMTMAGKWLSAECGAVK
jgi:hypothetical protein